MGITATRLDGQNVGLRLTGGATAVDVLTVNLTTGVATSLYLSSNDLAVVTLAGKLLFGMVPAAERATVTLLTRLVTVAPADDTSLSLSAVVQGGYMTLRATTGASPANLILHVPQASDGLVVWGVGYAGGGAPVPPAPAADYRFFTANCLASDQIGNAIYVTGPAVLGLPQVTKCNPSSQAKMPTIGVITDKADDTTCTVQRLGEVDLTGAAISFTAGSRVWVGYDGRPTTSPPLAAASPSGYVLLQPLGVATTEKTFELQISQSLTRINA